MSIEGILQLFTIFHTTLTFITENEKPNCKIERKAYGPNVLVF